jgi:transcriptional/translational regulatory protein YebC/TACO1
MRVGVPSSLTMVPTTSIPVRDDQARSLLKLLEELDDQEDVQQVYANFEVDDALLAEATKK